MMWTPYDTVTLLEILVGSWLLYFLGNTYLKAQWVQKLGAKVLTSKEHQLKTNPLLKLFSKLAEADKTKPATLLIFVLISLKNIGMLFGGIVFLGFILFPLQGGLMRVITLDLEKKKIHFNRWSKTLYNQLAGMLVFHAAGMLIGLKIWGEKQPLSQVLKDYYICLGILSIIALYLGYRAARNEVAFFKENHSLLS